MSEEPEDKRSHAFDLPKHMRITRAGEMLPSFSNLTPIQIADITGDTFGVNQDATEITIRVPVDKESEEAARDIFWRFLSHSPDTKPLGDLPVPTPLPTPLLTPWESEPAYPPLQLIEEIHMPGVPKMTLRTFGPTTDWDKPAAPTPGEGILALQRAARSSPAFPVYDAYRQDQIERNAAGSQRLHMSMVYKVKKGRWVRWDHKGATWHYLTAFTAFGHTPLTSPLKLLAVTSFDFSVVMACNSGIQMESALYARKPKGKRVCEECKKYVESIASSGASLGVKTEGLG